mmetsp:Transcript_68499/g.160653  ORF Transcript_68499/g.160653 Transcript_68499/m.160653 type:complete len:129 (-) Transcript_68499:273-659(-)
MSWTCLKQFCFAMDIHEQSLERESTISMVMDVHFRHWIFTVALRHLSACDDCGHDCLYVVHHVFFPHEFHDDYESSRSHCYCGSGCVHACRSSAAAPNIYPDWYARPTSNPGAPSFGLATAHVLRHRR